MINAEQIKMLVLDVDGTMTDGKINVTEEGKQFKQFDSKDGLGIKMLLRSGIIVGIISHCSSGKAIHKRANMLGIKHVYAGDEQKDIILEGWLKKLKLSFEQVAYIGDDLNDLPAMQKVGISACPSDAVADVLAIADVILQSKGGDSCVREFIDKLIPLDYGSTN